MSSRTRAPSSRRDGGGRESAARSSAASRSSKAKRDYAFMFFLYPVALTGLFLLAGNGYIFMFKYDPGGAVYRIGAQGYNIKGQNVV